MTRAPLPARRRTMTFDLQWPPTSFRPQTVTVSLGLYHGGKPGELFINAGKSGEQLEAATRDGAVILSLALQYGVPLDTIAKAITRDEGGTAASMIGAVIDEAMKQAGQKHE